MSWLQILGLGIGVVFCMIIFQKLKTGKKQRFMRESLQFFYGFGDAAKIPEERITSLIPRSSASKQHIVQVYHDRMKPIDAAMVMADMCVREAKQKVESVKNGDMKKFIKAQEDTELKDSGFTRESVVENLSAWAEGSLKDAEKLQFKAFEMGPQLGSLIALQEGKFAGRFDGFTGPA